MHLSRVVTCASFALVLICGGSTSGAVARPDGSVHRSLDALGAPITVEFQRHRLRDVLAFLENLTGVQFEPFWAEGGAPGLDPERLVSIRAREWTLVDLLERILTPAHAGIQCTWQLTPNGTIQVGPKEELNQFRQTRRYDVRDLLLTVPTFDEAPQIDLPSLLQQAQGRGGGQVPLRPSESPSPTAASPSDRVAELIATLVEAVEPDQWFENGGDAARIRYSQGGILVTAPEYIHRQLGGCPR